MSYITPSYTGSSFGQPMVKGCYHCGRMVRDLRDEEHLDSPVACSICIDAGYKMPPTIKEQQTAHQNGGSEGLRKLFADLGKPTSDQAGVAPVASIKNPSDSAVHKADEKELLDSGKGA